MDLIIEALNFDLPPTSEGYAQLGNKLNTALLAGMKVKARRALGDVEADTDSHMVRRVREREAAKAKHEEMKAKHEAEKAKRDEAKAAHAKEKAEKAAKKIAPEVPVKQ